MRTKTTISTALLIRDERDAARHRGKRTGAFLAAAPIVRKAGCGVWL